MTALANDELARLRSAVGLPTQLPRRARRVRVQIAGGVANSRRQARAAALTCERVREALNVLGDRVPAHVAQAARLRLQYPDLSLGQLAELSREGETKSSYAGMLRRLLNNAERIGGASS